jgi:ABC-type phosphate transport system substrate-binding protein
MNHSIESTGHLKRRRRSIAVGATLVALSSGLMVIAGQAGSVVPAGATSHYICFNIYNETIPRAASTQDCALNSSGAYAGYVFTAKNPTNKCWDSPSGSPARSNYIVSTTIGCGAPENVVSVGTAASEPGVAASTQTSAFPYWYNPLKQGTGRSGDIDLNTAGSPSAQLTVTGAGPGLFGSDVILTDGLDTNVRSYSAANPDVTFGFAAVGPDVGVSQVTTSPACSVVCVGFSDVPLNATTIASDGLTVTSGSTSDYVQVPDLISGVVVDYNLGVGLNHLRLDANVLAGIYSGHISHWYDPAIVDLNGGFKKGSTTVGASPKAKALLALSTNSAYNDGVITAMEDGSGDSHYWGGTYAFTNYLATASGVTPGWVPSSAPNSRNLVSEGWGASSHILVSTDDSGFVSSLEGTPGAIGYVGFGEGASPGSANPSALQDASLQDAAGNFILPSLKDIASAAADKSAASGPVNPTNFSIVNETGVVVNAWPISTYGWAIIGLRQDSDAGVAAAKFLDWVTHGAQRLARTEGFDPITTTDQAYARNQLETVEINGVAGAINVAATTTASNANTASASVNTTAGIIPDGVPDGSEPSGEAPPGANAMTGYALAYSTDFTGSSLPRGWSAYSGTPSGDPGGQFGSAHAVVGAGMLSLNTWEDPAYNNEWVTGGVCDCGNSPTYGAFFVRSRVTGSGPTSVELLYPNSGWPPEVDFYETAGGTSQNVATVHWGSSNSQYHSYANADLTQWHTWGVIWTATSITYTLDGQVFDTVTDSEAQLPNVPMHLALQQQTWCASGWACPTVPASMQVDWVVEFTAT